MEEVEYQNRRAGFPDCFRSASLLASDMVSFQLTAETDSNWTKILLVQAWLTAEAVLSQE